TPVRGDGAGFHRISADNQDGALRLPAPRRFANGNPGIDMSPGAPAGDDHFHEDPIARATGSASGRDCTATGVSPRMYCEMFSKMPTWIIVVTSEVPPK